MYKKLLLGFSSLVALAGNVHAYELATSVYYPLWKNTDPVMQEVTLSRYSQNYFNKTFLNQIEKIFFEEFKGKKASEHDALMKRILDAVLGFHSKAVEEGNTGFFARISNTATDFNQRSSNMLDFIAIPIVKKQNIKISLNDYTTKLRKEAIDNATGREWAGGRTVFLTKKYYGESTWVSIVHPARLEGVEYNSFVSEISTILQAAQKYGLEMDILEQIEKVAVLDHDSIEENVANFNKDNIGDKGLDHPLYKGYGYLNIQKNILDEATKQQKIRGWNAGENFLKTVMYNEEQNAMPKKIQVSANTDLSIYKRLGASLPTVDAPELLEGSEMKTFKFTWFYLHLPALKQLYPEVWENY